MRALAAAASMRDAGRSWPHRAPLLQEYSFNGKFLAVGVYVTVREMHVFQGTRRGLCIIHVWLLMLSHSQRSFCLLCTFLACQLNCFAELLVARYNFSYFVLLIGVESQAWGYWLFLVRRFAFCCGPWQRSIQSAKQASTFLDFLLHIVSWHRSLSCFAELLALSHNSSLFNFSFSVGSVFGLAFAF